MEKIIQIGAEAEIILVDKNKIVNKKNNRLKSSPRGGRAISREKIYHPKKSRVVSWSGEGGWDEERIKKLVIKRRVPKSYRLKELDEKIRKLRTRSEAKILEKASKIIPVPKIIGVDENKKEIVLEYINGKKLSEDLDDFPLKKQKEICKKIGENISRLHNADIIHGDLTTSNMIYVRDFKKNVKPNDKLNTDFSVNLSAVGASGNKNTFKIFFIDFGLGFISQKIEDKAVDLHLLKEALEARHFKNWKILFSWVLKGYKISKNFQKTIVQLDKVESRGRYKEKY